MFSLRSSLVKMLLCSRLLMGHFFFWESCVFLVRDTSNLELLKIKRNDNLGVRCLLWELDWLQTRNIKKHLGRRTSQIKLSLYRVHFVVKCRHVWSYVIVMAWIHGIYPGTVWEFHFHCWWICHEAWWGHTQNQNSVAEPSHAIPHPKQVDMGPNVFSWILTVLSMAKLKGEASLSSP